MEIGLKATGQTREASLLDSTRVAGLGRRAVPRRGTISVNMATGILGGAPGGITFSATVGPTWMQTEWSKVRAEPPSILTPPMPLYSPPHHDAWSVPDGLAHPRRVLSFTPWPTSRHVLSSGCALPHSLRSPRTPLLLCTQFGIAFPGASSAKTKSGGTPGGNGRSQKARAALLGLKGEQLLGGLVSKPFPGYEGDFRGEIVKVFLVEGGDDALWYRVRWVKAFLFSGRHPRPCLVPLPWPLCTETLRGRQEGQGIGLTLLSRDSSNTCTQTCCACVPLRRSK